MTANSGAYLTISFFVALFYLSLAVYVLLHRGRDSIAWVFAGLCLSITGTYLANLFLVVRGPEAVMRTLVPIRFRWALTCLSPVLYLHLNAYFFPRRWRQVVGRWVPGLYVVSSALAVTALLTPWFIAAPLLLHTGVVNWVQGPLFHVYWALMGVSLLLGVSGLLAGLRQARSRLLRQQILYMLIPIGLLVIGSLLPGRKADGYEYGVISNSVKAIVLVSGLLYARAVLDYGTFVGRPLNRRGFALLSTAIVGGSILFGGLLAIDGWLSRYTIFPLPLLTTLVTVMAGISYRVINQKIGPSPAVLLAAEELPAIEEQPAFRNLRIEPDVLGQTQRFLQGMCSTFRARGGFVAVRTGPDTADVLTSWQLAEPAAGAAITLPRMLQDGPHFVTAFGSLLMPEPFWQEMVLLSPFRLRDEQAILVLAEKVDQSPFTYAELNYGARLVNWFGELEQQLAAELLPESVIAPALPLAASASGALRGSLAAEPLAVYALRPLTVAHDGQRVSQEAWGSEKAKGMLAYLLWRGEQGASREALCDALWPGREDEDSSNVFHVTLHRLRRVLEPERKRGSAYVVYEHGRYRLQPARAWWTDVAAFEQLVGQDDADSLAAAVDLYRTGYLEDVAWALPAAAEIERRRLERLYEQALRRLVELLPTRERAGYLRRLLQLIPTDASANQMLLADYILLGRTDLAQKHMDWLRDLSDEDEIGFS